MQTTMIYFEGDILKMNPTLQKWFGNQKELFAIIEGDSLIIKKSNSLLDFAKEQDKNALTMEEINKEVHKARNK
jgi:hypothetical protein